MKVAQKQSKSRQYNGNSFGSYDEDVCSDYNRRHVAAMKAIRLSHKRLMMLIYRSPTQASWFRGVFIGVPGFG